MRDKSLDYLRYRLNSDDTQLVVTELEEINKYKLRDSDMMSCSELREYYLHRQGQLISYLRELFDGVNKDVL